MPKCLGFSRRHRWSQWVVAQNYCDTSFSACGTPSSILYRQCKKCHFIQRKVAFGVDLPVDSRYQALFDEGC